MSFINKIRKLFITKEEKERQKDKELRIKMIAKNGYTWYQYTRYDNYFKDKQLD